MTKDARVRTTSYTESHQRALVFVRLLSQGRFARSLGWEHWTTALGLRADEPRRVARLGNIRERWEAIAPLSAAGVTKEAIMRFWQTQPFDLRLPSIDGKTPLGNCDLCFLKSAATVQGIMRDQPHLAGWWIEQERRMAGQTRSPSVAVFRKDRPDYAAMLAPCNTSRPWTSENAMPSPSASAMNDRPG